MGAVLIYTSDLVKTQCDILVIGAGLAGLSAAVRVRELNPKVNVRLVTKVHPVRSHSGAAQGGINAAIRENDNWEDHKFDTVKGSGFLADQDAVRVLTSEAPEAIYRLDRYGSLFSPATRTARSPSARSAASGPTAPATSPTRPATSSCTRSGNRRSSSRSRWTTTASSCP